MGDYRNLLTINEAKPKQLKNILEVWTEWDSNDGDYIERTTEIDPKVLFENKKLIYCLAYITLPYCFKGHDWNASAFNHHIGDNCDIDDLENIVFKNGFGCSCEWGHCHSCECIQITYYDENGKQFDINFTDIYKQWENMSYEEICNEINSI